MAGGLVRTALSGVKASGFNAGDAINIAFAASDFHFNSTNVLVHLFLSNFGIR